MYDAKTRNRHEHVVNVWAARAENAKTGAMSPVAFIHDLQWEDQPAYVQDRTKL